MTAEEARSALTRREQRLLFCFTYSHDSRKTHLCKGRAQPHMLVRVAMGKCHPGESPFRQARHQFSSGDACYTGVVGHFEGLESE